MNPSPPRQNKQSLNVPDAEFAVGATGSDIPLNLLFLLGVLGREGRERAVAARHGGSEARHAVAARYPTADQDLLQTLNRPIRDGLGQNTDLNVPNVRALAFIANPAHLQFGVHPIHATAKKRLRRQTSVRRIFGAMILKVIQTPWKTLLALSLRSCMVKLRPLFDRVAGVHTNPAPAR